MGIKKFNPYTPSRRQMTALDHSEITKNTPEKSLTVALKKTAGRNNQGKITVRHHGGGEKRKYRIIDFKRNKKEKQLALKSVLTACVNDDKFVVLDALKMEDAKTKELKKVLDALKVEKALVVMDNNDLNVVLSARNLPGVKTALVNTINVFDILKYDTVVTTKAGVAAIEEVYA